MTLRPDAGRYECGTLNTIGCFGLRAAIEFLLAVGIEPISEAVLALTRRIEEGARAKGYEVLEPGGAGKRSGIVSFRKQGIDPRFLTHRLKEQGIIVAPRLEWVRSSPHFYISPAEIDRMIDAL